MSPVTAQSEAKPGFRVREAHVITAILVVVFASYAALGRDIFFNPLTTATVGDPLSENLIYLRLASAGALILVLLLHLGLPRILGMARPELLPFIAVAILSVVWSPTPKETFRAGMLLLLLYLSICLAIRRLGAPAVARIVLNIIAPVVILSALLAIFVPSIGVHSATDALQGSHAGRWRGIFSHKNALGPWAAYGLALLTTQHKLVQWPRWYLVSAIAASALCLINSNSATAMIGAVIMFAAYFALKFAPAMKRGTFVFAALTGGAIMAFALQYASSALLQLLGRDDTLTGRREIWPIALDYIRQHLAVGSGFGTVGGPAFFEVTAQHFSAALGPENAYLSLLLELGLIGFILFFGCLAIGLWRGIGRVAASNPEEAMTAQMFCMIVAASLVMAMTEATPYLASGYGGFIVYVAIIGLLGLSEPARRGSRGSGNPAQQQKPRPSRSTKSARSSKWSGSGARLKSRRHRREPGGT